MAYKGQEHPRYFSLEGSVSENPPAMPSNAKKPLVNFIWKHCQVLLQFVSQYLCTLRFFFKHTEKGFKIIFKQLNRNRSTRLHIKFILSQ